MRPESLKWVDFAREDLIMAGLALEAKLFNQTCFHAQQCCEKCLKALSHEHIGTPPKTHKLADLLTILSAFVPSELADRIRLLDRFYIPTRYPDALPGSLAEGLPNQADAVQAKEIASDCFNSLFNMSDTEQEQAQASMPGQIIASEDKCNAVDGQKSSELGDDDQK